jgi:sugar/nucleoside kinase (ribokinase family)
MCGVDPASDAAKADWEGILKKTLPYVDFFLPSAEELLFMLDRARYESLAGRSGGDILRVLNIDEDIAPLAERCLKMGARVALIKCGCRGIYYKTASPAFFAGLSPSLNLAVEHWAGREGFELSYKPDAVVSATGAGDTCIAGFLSAILAGYPPEKCLQLAAAVGASCVTAYDALGGIRPFPELEQKIDSGWEKSGR